MDAGLELYRGGEAGNRRQAEIPDAELQAALQKRAGVHGLRGRDAGETRGGQDRRATGEDRAASAGEE